MRTRRSILALIALLLVVPLTGADERPATVKVAAVQCSRNVDRKQDWRGYGFSTIISPKGEVAATAKSLHGSEIVYAEIPTAARR